MNRPKCVERLFREALAEGDGVDGVSDDLRLGRQDMIEGLVQASVAVPLDLLKDLAVGSAQTRNSNTSGRHGGPVRPDVQAAKPTWPLKCPSEPVWSQPSPHASYRSHLSFQRRHGPTRQGP